MYENKGFEGQPVRLFELVEGRIGSSYGAISSRSRFRIGSSYGAISSRSKVLNRKLVQSYFESVEGRMALLQLLNQSEEYRFFPQLVCELTEHL
jgi:hypothetical protein